MKKACIDRKGASEQINEAAEAIKESKLVAFPTETVYGLGADATSREAVQQIFAVKQRPADNPLIVHVTGARMAEDIASAWPETAQILAERLWPGPLTLVLPKNDFVPDVTTGGLETVAVRAPENPVARQLIEAAETPIAAPSANPYRGLSPTTAEHVEANFDGGIEWLLDAGPTEVGIESTVVSLLGAKPMVLRPGMITAGWIEQVLAEGGEPLEVRAEVSDEQKAKSPGSDEVHYAPDARVELFNLDFPPENRESDGGVVYTERGAKVVDDVARVEQLKREPDSYARHLYAALHRLDEANVDRILVEAPPRHDVWAGIWDRLKRASTES
jgi:L-threonylcarbamoyladenylate synthase